MVVPLYNEADSIQELYGEIVDSCRKARLSCEILFVDDGSTDGSFEKLAHLHRKDPRVKVIRFRTNCGKSEALAAGFSAVSGKKVLTLDADLQDDPAEIPALSAKLDEGWDMVSGWKKKRRDPITKRIPSRLYNRVTSLLSGIRIHDFNCGLKMYRREVVDSLSLYGELHRYIPVLAAWEGFSVTEIPVHHRARKFGRTKYGFSRFAAGFFDLITVMFFRKYTRRPLHLFGPVGFFFSLAGIAVTVYLIVLRLTHASYLSNRPLLFIGVLALIVGVQFISMGLLGEMIARSHASRHVYRIRESLGVQAVEGPRMNP